MGLAGPVFCLTSPEALSIMTGCLELDLSEECLMSSLQNQNDVFIKLRGVIGGYLVDVILEEGGAGIARLVREGLAAKATLAAEDDERVHDILRRIEEDPRSSRQAGG